jgi:hypothetical protein
MTARPVHSMAIAVGAVLAVTGCGTTSLQQTLGAAMGSVSHAEPPVEIYSRIARGALSCWFGPQGSLKKTHIFHADAAPPTAGGEAEIILHERDTGAQSPRSLRWFRINVIKSGEGSTVQVENLRFPEPAAREMTADVVRWAGGTYDCSVMGVGGWEAKPAVGQHPPKDKGKAKGVQKGSR